MVPGQWKMVNSVSAPFVPQQNTHPGFEKGTTQTSKSSHKRLKPPQRTAAVRTAQPAPLAQRGVIQRQKQCCLTYIPMHKYGHCCGLSSVSKCMGGHKEVSLALSMPQCMIALWMPCQPYQPQNVLIRAPLETLVWLEVCKGIACNANHSDYGWPLAQVTVSASWPASALHVHVMHNSNRLHVKGTTAAAQQNDRHANAVRGHGMA
jgi:hypothetical protein